jgi:isoleucyl-tRNA synthetase
MNGLLNCTTTFIYLCFTFFVLFKIPYFRTSIKEKDKMSTKFTEYKGLDLPTVASEVLDFEERKHI